MAADVLLSIGISTDEAKRGHDQIIAYNNDIAASYDKVTAAAKSVGSQSGGAGTSDMVDKLTKTKTAADFASQANERLSDTITKLNANITRLSAFDGLADTVVKSAHAHKQASEAADAHGLAVARLDARLGSITTADLAYVTAEAELQKLLKSGAINASEYQVRLAKVNAAVDAGTLALTHHGQAVIKAGTATNGASGAFTNMQHTVNAAGLQIADIAIVSQMGSQAIGQMGIQVGQFLGVLGPTGAIAGAAVTVLGVLAGTYFNLSKDAEGATEEQELYNKSLEELVKLEKEYNEIIRGRPGLNERTATQQRFDMAQGRQRTATGGYELAGLGAGGVDPRSYFQQAADMARSAGRSSMQFMRDIFETDEGKKINAQMQANAEMQKTVSDLAEENALKEEIASKKLGKTISDLADARKNEIDIAKLASVGRDRDAAVIQGELNILRQMKELKEKGLTEPEIKEQARLSGETAGIKFDLEAQKKAREDAERERERATEKAAREAKQAQDARDRAIKSGNEYIASLAHQREALGMTNRDAAIFRAGLEEERRLQQGNIKETEEVYHTKVRLAKEAAAALYDEQEARGKVLSQAQIRDMASRMSPGISASANIEVLTKYRDELIKLGVTEQQIADAIVDANLKKLESSRDWVDGATGALMRYSRDASNYGQAAGRIVSNSFTSMENAIVGFASSTKTASQAFKEMAASIIQDLIRLQIRASITGPLSGMLSGIVGKMFSGGSGAEGYSGEYGGGSYEAVTGQTSGSLGFFASGTDYAPGGWAVVGENGPELMQLGGGERIYPAGETAAILSGKAANSNVSSGGGGNFTMAEGAVVVNAPGATAQDAAIIAQQVATAIVQQAAPEIIKRSLSASKAMADRGGSYAQAMGRR